MRLVLLLTVLISVAAPAYAEGARESRYGPTVPRQATQAPAVVRYDGPMLSWSNKRQAGVAVPAPQASAPTQPAPLTSWAGYRPAPAPVVTPLAAAPSTPSPPPPVAPTAPPPPTSLYSAPRPSPVVSAAPVAAPTKDWSSYRSDRMTKVAPAAAPVTQPAAPAPRQIAAADTRADDKRGTGARYYSVGREYGLTPDAVPPVGPDTRVLVTTTEPPPEARDAVPMHGSADWLAAGARGDEDDDDSAARRAKSRNQAQ